MTLDAPAGIFDGPSAVSATTNSERAGRAGRPLDEGLRTKLERAYETSFAEVRVIEDGVAESLSVRAVARGQDLHFAKGAYDPSSAEGQHVIAHELAHVAQQRTATDAAPAAQPALNKDPSLEHEAENAAHAALSGSVVKISRGVVARSFQGFDSWEHKKIGDDATGDAEYTMGGGMTLTHGDLTQLMGDYFDTRPDSPASDNILVLAKRPSPKPGAVVGTQDEIIAALKDASNNDPRFAPGGIWARLTFSDAVTDSVKDRFRRLALKNREHFQRPRDGKDEGYGPGESAGGSYRAMHEQAVMDAYKAGTRSADLNDAMIYEALGQHFLTDSFSSGHMRTPRADLQDYWNGVYPQFKPNFVTTLGAMVGTVLYKNRGARLRVFEGIVGGSGTTGKANEALMIAAATQKAKEAIGTAGPPGLGDLLSSILHDADNEQGLEVINDLGWTWKAYGDDNMMKGPPSKLAGGRTHFDIATLAVQLGNADLQFAYRLGQQDKNKGREQILAAVRQGAGAPAKPSGKYAPEQLVPRLAQASPTVNGEQEWKAASFQQLLTQKVRTDTGETFEQGLVRSSQGGTILHQLEGVAASLDTYEKLAGANMVFPYEAFRDGVIVPLTADPIAMFKRILGGKP